MSADVTTVPLQALIDLAQAPINPFVTVVAVRESGQSALHYYVADGRHERADQTLAVIRDLRAVASRDGVVLPEAERIIVQAEDTPIDTDSVSWERKSGWRNVRLIPDLYYIWAHGYEDTAPCRQPWGERYSSIIWRGSSTGLLSQRAEDLERLPRYRMAQMARGLGERADIGITDVVQAADPNEGDRIRARMHNEGLLRGFVPMNEMAGFRYIMDIGGNSNSWNFMAKLRLGCCVLQVESEWRQWFSHRLTAWEHYVPVAADLSDFIERAEWCFNHPAEAAAIAERGQTFAVEMTFSQEMSQAARTVFASAIEA